MPGEMNKLTLTIIIREIIPPTNELHGTEKRKSADKREENSKTICLNVIQAKMMEEASHKWPHPSN